LTRRPRAATFWALLKKPENVRSNDPRGARSEEDKRSVRNKMNSYSIPQGMVIAAQSAEFWRRLAPGLTISDTLPSRVIERSEAAVRQDRERLSTEGYVHMDQPGIVAPYDAIANAMERIEQARLPAAFVAVFDEVWAMAAQMQGVVSDLLETDAALVPDFWATFSRPGDAGAAAGRKRPGKALNDDGSPNTLSAWMPITEATTENGCVYVVPSMHDKNYDNGSNDRADAGLQAIRAVPAKPGDVLIWTGETYTWQSRTSQYWKGKPQMSLSWEFQSAAASPFEGYVVDSLPYVPFEMRLALIAQQMPRYGSELLKDRTWAALAQTLNNRFGNDLARQSA
jgi:hypothetical protein